MIGQGHDTAPTIGVGRDIVYLNLLDPSSWRIEQPVDVAYLCAGVCRMALCEEDPVGTANINIDATLALARKLAANGTFLVYLSTNQVFLVKILRQD